MSVCVGLLTENEELETEDRMILEYSLLLLSAVLVSNEGIARRIFAEAKTASACQEKVESLLSGGLFYEHN